MEPDEAVKLGLQDAFLISVGLPFEIVGVGNISGDGQADIVWHDRQSNETQIWRMNGHRIVRRETVVDERGEKISPSVSS